MRVAIVTSMVKSQDVASLMGSSTPELEDVGIEQGIASGWSLSLMVPQKQFASPSFMLPLLHPPKMVQDTSGEDPST